MLWLAPDSEWSDPLTGATVHTLTDPTDTAATIARAVTSAVRNV
ncbi:hypothetical protein [Nocardia sp. NPDC050710]